VFDHSGVTASCSTCHNGVTATGKPGDHIQTSGQCDDCHGTLAWIPASVDHSLVTGSCSACHNGTTATGKPPSHFVTSLQCDECHRTTAWVPMLRYRHSSGDYPGDHSSGVRCTSCHQSNTESVTWPFSAYRPDCAGCHANDFENDEHKKVDGPRILYTVSELRDCTGACHQYTDSSFSTIEKSRTGEHRVGRGEW
jgi:hypothetical protein